MRPALSSDTSSAPSGITSTSAGRPDAAPPLSQPAAKGSYDVARPLSIYADTFGTGSVPEEAIERAVAEVMDLTPKGIRTQLGLNRPIYQRTSAYGHFGRAPDNEGGFSWERTDLTEALARAV